MPGEHRVYNLGNGTGFSVREVIDICREVTGVDIPAGWRRGGRRPRRARRLVAAHQLRARLARLRDLRAMVADAWAFAQAVAAREEAGSPMTARPGGQRWRRAGGRTAAQAADWFRDWYGDAPQGVWHAPGRVNLVGEHTDYNEGFVLPFALGQGVAAAAASREDDVGAATRRDPAARVEHPAGPAAAASRRPRRRSVRDGIPGWATYPAGVAWALRDAGHPVGGAASPSTRVWPTGPGCRRRPRWNARSRWR